MTESLALPSVHMNGTSRESLVESTLDAAHHVNAARKALQAAGPNGRDYYPQGPEAYGRALAQHCARVEKLDSVYRDLEAIAESLSDTGPPPGPAIAAAPPAPQTATFEVGRTYSTRSIGDYDCIYSFTILARTAKTVTVEVHGETVKRGLSVYRGAEQFKPHGTHSMCAIIHATDRDLS